MGLVTTIVAWAALALSLAVTVVACLSNESATVRRHRLDINALDHHLRDLEARVDALVKIEATDSRNMARRLRDLEEQRVIADMVRRHQRRWWWPW